MPVYLYQNPINGEIKEVIQTTSEPHVYEENGVDFKRIFTIPNASVDTRIDSNSPKDFVNKTRNKRGSLGDLWQTSAELSEKRGGVKNDHVRQKYLENWSKIRGGRDHPDIVKQKTKEIADKSGFVLED